MEIEKTTYLETLNYYFIPKDTIPNIAYDYGKYMLVFAYILDETSLKKKEDKVLRYQLYVEKQMMLEKRLQKQPS